MKKDDIVATRPMDELASDYVLAMGPELGQSFFALHGKLVELHVVWLQYRQLFGNDPETVQMLNRTAGLFFKIVQDELWDSVLLGITRMTDPQKTSGRTNLTLRSLPELISNDAIRIEVTSLCEIALDHAEFAREHRNKRIAHQDHGYMRDSAANPLSGVSRERVVMLASLREVLNRIDSHYRDSTTIYEGFVDHSGASLLVHKLHRFERIASNTKALQSAG